jgi:hypothetical protein
MKLGLLISRSNGPRIVSKTGLWSDVERLPKMRIEECRLLGYKYTVRTSQETHYVSATESSLLMLCTICGFHGDDCEECRLLGYKNPVFTS